MKLRTPRVRNRRSYGAAQNPFHPEKVKVVRLLLSMGLGSFLGSIAGSVVGALTPGLTARELGRFGAFMGAGVSGYKSLKKHGAITDDGPAAT